MSVHKVRCKFSHFFPCFIPLPFVQAVLRFTRLEQSCTYSTMKSAKLSILLGKVDIMSTLQTRTSLSKESCRFGNYISFQCSAELTAFVFYGHINHCPTHITPPMCFFVRRFAFICCPNSHIMFCQQSNPGVHYRNSSHSSYIQRTRHLRSHISCPSKISPFRPLRLTSCFSISDPTNIQYPKYLSAPNIE